jgi:hypothetical protein
MIALALLLGQSVVFTSPAYAQAAGPRISARAVDEDKTVVLVGAHLRADTRYTVYLSKFNKYPASATRVGFAVTDSLGSFTKTFKIPKKLVDVIRISVTITDDADDTATNWFINASAVGNTGGLGAPNFTIRVTTFKRDAWVKIRTNNMPANVTFEVLMGKVGSRGIKIGELMDEDGGAITEEFDIPDELEGKEELFIRLENRSLGYSANVTFRNR